MATRIKFTSDFVWTPPSTPAVSIGYKAGMRELVPDECAQAAIAAGKGERMARSDVAPRVFSTRRVRSRQEVEHELPEEQADDGGAV